MDNIKCGRERLKDIVEKVAREKEEETAEETKDKSTDLKARENERA